MYQELFGRIPPLVRATAAGLDADALARTPQQGANSVGWLLWHLTRVQDHHVSELLGQPQVWVSEPWPQRFGLTADPHNTGFGHGAADIAAVRPDGPAAIVGYHEAVAVRTDEYLGRLSPDELDRVIDRRWDPPVTLGVRLVSICDDSLQHAGQAAYARGLVEPGWRVGY